MHVPALPLQLLVRRHPEWMHRPVAVVDRDKPQGKILWVNEAAYRVRVLPGFRYAAGLSRCGRLCAGTVHEEEIDAGVHRLLELLWRFSPEVEPSADEPGVFWVNAGGLQRIERSLLDWSCRLRAELKCDGFVARVAVGFRRFESYAAARITRDITVFDTPKAERDAALAVRLDRLHIEPELRGPLAKLGVHTVRQFIELPVDGLGKRFGAGAVELYKKASDRHRRLLLPVPPPVPVQTSAEFEYPEADANRLTFYMKRWLPALLEQLAVCKQGLAELTVVMALDDGNRVVKCVRPARATLELAVILDLVRLRLGGADISAGVIEMTVTAHGKPVDDGQLSLFWSQPKRDTAAADRALARVRAEFGREAVVWAKVRDAHLPEASFTWERLARTKLPQVDDDGADGGAGEGGPRGPRRAERAAEDTAARNIQQAGGSRRAERAAENAAARTTQQAGDPRDPQLTERAGVVGRFVRPLVRRVFDKAVQLPVRERHERDGWLIGGFEQGPAVRVRGPYVVSGGWWVREVHREYYFVETKRGDVLWVYYDRERRNWMMQGRID